MKWFDIAKPSVAPPMGGFGLHLRDSRVVYHQIVSTIIGGKMKNTRGSSPCWARRTQPPAWNSHQSTQGGTQQVDPRATASEASANVCTSPFFFVHHQTEGTPLCSFASLSAGAWHGDTHTCPAQHTRNATTTHTVCAIVSGFADSPSTR